MDSIDLSDEYIRQFYGDVMLFSIEQLVQQGYPYNTTDEELIREILETTHASLLSTYKDKLQYIQERVRSLRLLINNEEYWWNNHSELQAALQQANTFINNISNNFGLDAKAWRLIMNHEHHEAHVKDMITSIMQYPKDINLWQTTLDQ